MKTQSEHTCQAALDALLTRLEEAPFNRPELDELCRQFPDCTESLHSTYELWQQLDLATAPEPSPAMHAGFYRMLETFTAETATAKPRLRFDWWAWNGLSLKWAVIAGVFVLGLLSGHLFGPLWSGGPAAVAEETERKTAADRYARLAASESAADRLLGLQLVKQMNGLDERIIEALYQTLLHDPNVNVRLSAVEAMLHFAENPLVRENLIRAIPYQTAPLVQLALAEVVLALKDKRAVEQIKQLLDTGTIELEVKMKLEDALTVLI